MKRSTLFFLSVAFARGESNSALGAKVPIDRFELLRVGTGVPHDPCGTVSNLQPLKAKIFFEVHPDRLAGGEGVVKSEIFTGGNGTGSCTNGGHLLETTNNYTISSESYAYPEYSQLFQGDKWPQTTNGVIVASNISISDINGPTGEKAIYRPVGDGSPDNIGHLVLCVRNSIQMNQQYLTYVDVRLKLSIDLNAGSFGGDGDPPPPSMGITVSVDPNSATGGKTIETTKVAEVQVDSFLCGWSALNDGKPFQDAYSIGQSFQICVGPAAGNASQYEIVDFKSIECENSNHKRIIVSNGVIDPLSEIIKDAGGSRGLVEGQVIGDNGIAFRSVISAAFFQGGVGANASSIRCRGEVSLASSKNSTRKLVHTEFPGFEHRFLQNTRQDTTPFATSVAVKHKGVFESPVERPTSTAAAMVHGGRSIILGMGIAIAMILAF